MTKDARDLLERALQLPEEDRALLVDALSQTLGTGPLDPAFAKELVKRAQRVLDGDRGTPAHEAMARLRAKHGLDR